MKYHPFILSFSLCVIFFIVSCISTEKTHTIYPQNFNSFSDLSKLDWLLENTSPEQLAQLSCYIGGGKDSIFEIKDLKNFIQQSYISLPIENRVEYGIAFRKYEDSLNNKQRMTLYYNCFLNEGQRLGYILGIRGNLDGTMVILNKEIAVDSLFYKDFQKGIKISNLKI